MFTPPSLKLPSLDWIRACSLYYKLLYAAYLPSGAFTTYCIASFSPGFTESLFLVGLR